MVLEGASGLKTLFVDSSAVYICELGTVNKPKSNFLVSFPATTFHPHTKHSLF
jgi:hypothetical protein